MYICIYIHIYIYIFAIEDVENFVDSEKSNIFVLNFCVHYLCLIGWVYVFYVGHVDRIDYMKLFSIL
jgi:hypothetical protein